MTVYKIIQERRDLFYCFIRSVGATSIFFVYKIIFLFV